MYICYAPVTVTHTRSMGPLYHAPHSLLTPASYWPVEQIQNVDISLPFRSVGIVGVGERLWGVGYKLQTLIFEWLSVSYFSTCAKLQTFRHLTLPPPPVLLGQFLHCHFVACQQEHPTCLYLVSAVNGTIQRNLSALVLHRPVVTATGISKCR